jgi:hypothetical protein
VELGRLRPVQFIPSGDVAAELLPETATNVPFPYVTDSHSSEAGRLRAVQFIPSGEVAAVPLL